MSLNRTYRLRSLAVLSAAVFLASCGGGGDDVAATPTPSPAPGSPTPSPPPPAPAPAPGADTTAPTATLVGPANLASGLTGTLTLSATATDNVGVTGIDFEVDGLQVGTTIAAASAQTTINTNDYASGQHVVRTRARDAAGNQSAWASATVRFGGTRTQPAGFTRTETALAGIADATAIAQAPDGRFFIAQQGGALRVIKNGTLLATPFITLTVDTAGERGLLGVAFHPNFATNGFIYLYYTTPENGIHNRISRFTANGDIVSVGSEVRIADLPTLVAGNHNGGALHFGSDGKLYVGVGDNAVGANSQNASSPLGKMLRFNDDGTTLLANAVWATGLRNPYTFAVKPGTSDLYINDVGEGTWEEINIRLASATAIPNFGWPGSEGPDNVTGNITAPAFAYRHTATTPAGSGPGGFFTGIAIIGGAFYPDVGPFPATYRGSYFFADLGGRFVARYDSANNAAYAFGAVTGAPVGMLTGLDGAVYVLTQTSLVRFSAP